MIIFRKDDNHNKLSQIKLFKINRYYDPDFYANTIILIILFKMYYYYIKLLNSLIYVSFGFFVHLLSN